MVYKASMYASPLYFRQFRTSTRAVNFGNTVLVRRDTGQWWLGYVQDIDSDRFLVDFDSTTDRPAWIQSGQLWPHEFLRQSGVSYRGQSVQVALRDVPGGPMVFRPGTITRELCNNMFNGVRLDGADHNQACIVDTCQIVTELPIPNKPSFAESGTTFVYRKHVVPFEQAKLLRDVTLLPKFVGRTCRITLGPGDTECDADCEFALANAVGSGEQIFRCAGLHSLSFYMFDVGCRVFARVDTETVTFVCVEMHDNVFGRSMFWTDDDLREACDACLKAQQPRLAPGILCEDGLTDTFQTDGEEMHINELAYPILANILLHFDMITRLQLMQVQINR
ncbi:uncharacterized protein LOC129600220 isoform X2 [Paramacrobiotus metropolitanus]|uniref:uncharacterized protein LOC129600220 isoform X2 n=1 Tax=Paramacrobiotus metropolitanus TaxID=2943436 RepID=UPI00244622C5|nr:uncharacterized protein LOC129600220 isoform X2 [Paramacrobiotus metropolitanus]XP_055354649.1 uncharacterized protein LOC129600220 isoform X2 [Paramacrobiotus metropolitanus]